MAIIKQYTITEGSLWLSWTNASAYVDLDRLSSAITAAKARKTNQCYINGKLIHSLTFEDGREWDCINGFRRLERGTLGQG